MMLSLFSTRKIAVAALLALAMAAGPLVPSVCGQSEIPGKDFGKYDKWKKHVSSGDKSRANPLAANPLAAAAGGKLFSESCARCHGSDAAGHRGKPSLRGRDVITSSDGEIFWIINNGDLAHNMPAFPQMPDAERWQIVAYLRSLPPLTPTAVPGSPIPNSTQARS